MILQKKWRSHSNMPKKAILICPNAFKESIAATEVAGAMQEGILEALPTAETILLPLADGGDGSLEVLRFNLELEMFSLESRDALGRKIPAVYGMSKNKEAFIEMADTSGLHRINPGERKVLEADSEGTGICIRDALEKGAKSIWLFVGGTATMDGGHGILRALGFRFIDERGNELSGGVKDLHRLEEIILPRNIEELRKTEILILTDVEHTLCGPEGCSRVFAPQKGADEAEADLIDKALEHLAGVAERQTGINVRNLRGGGAAGGTPAGLYPWLNIRIRPGAEEILRICGFEEKASKAGLILTGEGKLDDQSLGGKLPVILAKEARKKNIPVVFIGGKIPEKDSAFDELFNGMFSIVPGPCSLEESMDKSYEWTKKASYRIMKLLSLSGFNE